jgi:hypothetical protein
LVEVAKGNELTASIPRILSEAEHFFKTFEIDVAGP